MAASLPDSRPRVKHAALLRYRSPGARLCRRDQPQRLRTVGRVGKIQPASTDGRAAADPARRGTQLRSAAARTERGCVAATSRSGFALPGAWERFNPPRRVDVLRLCRRDQPQQLRSAGRVGKIQPASPCGRAAADPPGAGHRRALLPKPIRWVDGGHEISCRLDGLAIGLKACVAKTALGTLPAALPRLRRREQRIQVECLRKHRQLTLRRARPSFHRPIPIQLHAIVVGIAQIQRLAHAMI